jgi:hypothetical protein
VDLAFQYRDFAVVDGDEITERLDAHRVRVREFHLVEQSLAAGPEHVLKRRQHPFFGHHRVHLGLEP